MQFAFVRQPPDLTATPFAVNVSHFPFSHLVVPQRLLTVYNCAQVVANACAGLVLAFASKKNLGLSSRNCFY